MLDNKQPVPCLFTVYTGVGGGETETVDTVLYVVEDTVEDKGPLGNQHAKARS